MSWRKDFGASRGATCARVEFMSDLVCLLKTPSLEEARVLECFLEAHGIPVCLGEAEMARQYWDFMVINGIRVLVPADRLEEAIQLTSEARQHAESDLSAQFGELELSPKRRDRWVIWAYCIFSLNIILLALLVVASVIARIWPGKRSVTTPAAG